jgi:hypothetical protein
MNVRTDAEGYLAHLRYPPCLGQLRQEMEERLKGEDFAVDRGGPTFVSVKEMTLFRAPNVRFQHCSRRFLWLRQK